MGWFNLMGLIIVIIIMIPNIIYFKKCPNGFTNIYKNKTIETLEQIGRFGCFILIIFNIPYTYFDFWFSNGKTIYIIVNSIFLLIYVLGWVICLNKWKIFRSYLLSITPSLMFLFSGIAILSIPLIVAATIFSFSHITISLKNAYNKAK